MAGNGNEEEINEEEMDLEDIDEDIIDTDDYFTTEEIFKGLDESFDVSTIMQVKVDGKVRLKRGKFRCRIPNGAQSAAVLRRKLSDFEHQNEMILRIVMKPKLNSKQVKKLPISFKAKILNVVNSRSGGLTISDANKKAADNF